MQNSFTTEPAGSSDAENGDEVAGGLTRYGLKKRKVTLKKSVRKEENDDAATPEPTTPKATKKRAPKAKKAAVTATVKAEGDDDVDNEAAHPSMLTTPSTKKRGAKGEIDTTFKKQKKGKAVGDDVETPSKGAKGRVAKFPESADDFTPQDKLLISMKKDGKVWPDIEKAWAVVTGAAPGKDVLRKRYPKLLAVAQEWVPGDTRKMVDIKSKVEVDTVLAIKKAEEDHAAAVRKLQNEKWGKISQELKAVGAKYTGAAVEKKWEQLVKKGEVDASGKYIGKDPVVDSSASVSGSTASGDDQDAAITDDKDEADVKTEAVEDDDADDEQTEE